MDTIVLILLLIYVLIILISILELTSLSVAALIGAILTAWFGIQYGVFDYEGALGFVDFRLLALLIGTMIVVEVAKRGGLFNVLALYAIKISKGHPARLFVSICIVAAVVSMFLSDPTAMLLVAAATVTITKLLNYDPTPYFLSAAIMINLGGTSTLIGSVSNMIIGIEAEITFIEFLSFLGFCELALWALTILALYFVFRSRLGERKVLPDYNPMEGIKDRRIFSRSAVILILLVVLFMSVDLLGVGPEAVALGCGILALLVSRVDPTEIFRELDWETIFFIAGFMFIIGGLEQTQFLGDISTQLFQFAGGSSLIATQMMLWVSGIASVFVSNIAVALTFTPIVSVQALSGLNLDAVWSGLILGTNLGGATTPFSGAVMMMAIGTLKREKIGISFGDFAKVGIITSLVQLSFSSIYLALRFGLIGG
ncbi:MAG: SLC13 family permease [Candidatus Bathyarchaeota archaeon]|nr:SLC13 family permease [Candidatus Bathyarchaeota archaeon]